MQLQTIDDGEAVSRRRRKRKSDWRREWIALTNAATLDSRSMRQIMRPAKLISGAYKHRALVVKELPVQPIEQPGRCVKDVVGHLKYEEQPNRRVMQRRVKVWDCSCEDCVYRRSVLNTRFSKDRRSRSDNEEIQRLLGSYIDD
jgi:hypothetical protein